jgi:hypothetical protein
MHVSDLFSYMFVLHVWISFMLFDAYYSFVCYTPRYALQHMHAANREINMHQTPFFLHVLDKFSTLDKSLWRFRSRTCMLSSFNMDVPIICITTHA